jgi:hypothetical protein
MIPFLLISWMRMVPTVPRASGWRGGWRGGSFSARPALLFTIVVLLLLSAAPLGAQQPSPPTWRLVEELRIGATDGPEALSRVSDLTVSSDGSTLYVGQQQEHTIRIFDAVTGEPRGRIGRHGEGPGEFRYVSFIGWRADTLYATDFLLLRFSLFSPAGKHFATEAIHPPLSENYQSSNPIGLTSEGTLLSQERLLTAPIAEGRVTSSPWALVARDGRVIRTVGKKDLRETRKAVPTGERTLLMPQPLSERNFLRLHPDGTSMVVVDQPAGQDIPGEYQVRRLRADGSQIYSLTYRYTPRAVPPAFSDSIHAFQTMVFEQLLPSGRAAEAARKNLVIPDAFPPISGLLLGRDDSVWLRKEDVGSGTVAWLVLDARGRVQAIAATPAGLHLRYADGEHIWGVVHDELDIPYVVRLRIVR